MMFTFTAKQVMFSFHKSMHNCEKSEMPGIWTTDTVTRGLNTKTISYCFFSWEVFSIIEVFTWLYTSRLATSKFRTQSTYKFKLSWKTPQNSSTIFFSIGASLKINRLNLYRQTGQLKPKLALGHQKKKLCTKIIFITFDTKGLQWKRYLGSPRFLE